MRPWCFALLATAALGEKDDLRNRIQGASLTVTTTNGAITGHTASNRSSVVEFLGVPYAQPPVKKLRFAPPVKYSSHGHQNASTWGLDCPLSPSGPSDYPGLTTQGQRILNYFASGAGTPQGEDCLTLNVWTKSQRRRYGPQYRRPLLVFFYGGRFSLGNTNSPFYNGQFFADAQDVVVVTVNFRSNVFGYPGIPGQTQNLGLRDQRLAVEWVRDNARAFGGDPSKIVIFGQSAGAVAVDWWSYAYVNDPIVSGLISHSGNAVSFPLNPPGTALKNWYNISSQLGCGSSGDTLECMRNQSWQEIKAAAAKVPSAPGGSPLRSIPGFYPVIDNETVYEDYITLSNTGKFAKLPYLLGNNNNEQGYYAIPAFARGINVTRAQSDAFLLSSFTCPNAFVANDRRLHGVPVWQFRYFGDWDNLRLYPGSGAYHGSDLEMIFGNSAQVSGVDPSPAELQTQALMQRAWATFARDPDCGLDSLGWPRFDPSTNSLIRLAFNNSPTADFVSPGLYDGACSNVTLAGALSG